MPRRPHRPLIGLVRLVLLGLSLVSSSSVLLVVSSSGPVLSGRGSSLAAATYQESLFAYSASGDWASFVSGTGDPLQTAGANASAVIAEGQRRGVGTAFTSSFVSSGSGDGKSTLIAGSVDFAGSDSPFSDTQFASYPDLQMVPSMASGVVIVYNLPELDQANAALVAAGSSPLLLILDRTLLPMIFAGNITQWNDPLILAWQTPTVATLLDAINASITVVVRGDGSGTSNIFSHALAAFSPAWTVTPADAPAWPSKLKYLKANLALGVNALVALKPYSLSYSPLGDALAVGLPFAALRNRAGRVVEATFSSITAALLEKGGGFDAHLNAQLNDALSPTSWPIVGYSYLCLRLDFSRSACDSRTLLVRWLRFFFTSATTATITHRHGLEAVPDYVATTVIDLLTQKLQCHDEPALNVVLPFSLTNGASAMPLALLQLLTVAYSATPAVYTASLVSTTSLEAVADVLTGQAATAIVAHIPAERLFLAEGDSTVTTTGTAQQTISLVLNEHPTIGVFPLAVTSLAVVHSVAFLAGAPTTLPLVLDLSTLAQIVLGSITRWNDSAIQSLNPGLSSYLPSARILLVLYPSSSDLTAVWRSTLTDDVPAFASSAGYGRDLTGLTFAQATATLVPIEARLEQAAIVSTNALAFVQYSSSITAPQVAIRTYRADAAVGAVGTLLKANQTTMAACIPSRFLDPANRTSLLVANPFSENPDNSEKLSGQTYEYDPADWNSIFSLDVRSRADNVDSCWPFSVSLYAVVPLFYSDRNRSSNALLGSDLTVEGATRLAAGSDTEPYRLQAKTSTCARGKDTLHFFYWLYQGGLLNFPQLSLGQLPLVESMRAKVRQSLEHANCDGQPILLTYPNEFHYSSALQGTTAALCAIGEVVCLALAIFIVLWRKTPVVRAASVPFCLYMVVGASLMFGCLPLLTVSIPTPATCSLTVWLLTLGFVTAFGSLLIKTIRIYRIMTMRTIKVVNISNSLLLRYLLALLFVVCVPLVVWQVQSPLDAYVLFDRSSSVLVQHQLCGSGAAGQIYLYLLIAILLLVMVVASVLAVLVRNVPSDFNESKLLGFSSYVCLMLLLVLIPGSLLLWSTMQRNALALLLAFGIFLNTLTMLSLMLGTKVWEVYSDSHFIGGQKRQVDMTQLSQVASHMREDTTVPPASSGPPRSRQGVAAHSTAMGKRGASGAPISAWRIPALSAARAANSRRDTGPPVSSIGKSAHRSSGADRLPPPVSVGAVAASVPSSSAASRRFDPVASLPAPTSPLVRELSEPSSTSLGPGTGDARDHRHVSSPSQGALDSVTPFLVPVSPSNIGELTALSPKMTPTPSFA